MALFKILRGPSSELANLPINDGYCYFTPDTGLFHIDYNGNRVPLNSKDAATIAGASLVHVLSENGSQLEIPSTKLIAELSKNLIDSIAGKQDKVSGEEGQLLGFDVNGQLVAVDAVSGSNGLIDQNTGELIKIWHGTTAEYENLEEKDDNTIYILTDELGGSITADSIEYYNSISGLNAKTVQEALDEIATTTVKADYVLETNKGLQQKFWRGTRVEYDALESKDEDTMYIILDEDASDNDVTKTPVGKNVEGIEYEIPIVDPNSGEITLQDAIAAVGAEIFNCYEDDTENGITANKAVGMYSHAEGMETTAFGMRSHAEGYHTIAIGMHSHAEGHSTAAIGMHSHVEGTDTTASGDTSHAEGQGTIASGYISHAEGQDTIASGVRSHAEGYDTTASGSNSHAEGYDTTASGSASHAEGYGTTANGRSMHVQGEFNIPDTISNAFTRSDYAHIVGNGTSHYTRSNAHTLDWNGNAWFAGEVYVSSYSGTNKDEGSKKLVTVDEMNAAIAAAIEAAFANIARAEEVEF